MFSQPGYTLTHVIIQLQSRGFDYDFKLREQGLYCVQSHCYLDKSILTVEECYHFPKSRFNKSGVIIYGISSMDQELKGILLYHPVAALAVRDTGWSVHSLLS